jgi:predicted permease
MGKRGSGTGTDGRLRPGISLDQAALELTALTTRLARERGEPADVHVQVRSLLEGTTANYRETLNILAAAVGLILLIACVNVAGLLLARGATRSSELAVRAAIGAGRARLIRQLLTESLVLSVLGGLAGVLLAWLSLDALVAIIPMSLPSNSPATMNLPVLAFTAGLSLLTSVIFGLVPAFRLSRVHVGAQLGRASIRHGSALSRRGGQLLIAAEVALAVVLLAGAGLMVRSFARIVSVNVGFDPRAIVTLQATPLDLRPGAFEAYYAALVNTIRAMPGVVAVGAVDQLPLGGISTGTRARVEGGAWVGVGIRQILPGYFEAMGLSLQQGRLPVDADRTTGGPSVVMNEDAAKLLFGDGAPVGRRVEVDKQSRVVIGVIGSVRHMGPRIPASAEVYMLFGQTDAKPLTIVVRPSNAGLSLDAQLRHAAVAIGPRVFLEGVRPGTDWFEDRVLTDRHRTWLFGLLGGLGLLLTLVGIFGTTAYAVARRTPEIGVRMAFGARPTQVVQMMVRDAAWPVGIGTIVGLGGATLGTRVIQTFLFNTAPTDHVTFAAVALTLGFTACVAAWIPARRAARVDPLTALRSE